MEEFLQKTLLPLLSVEKMKEVMKRVAQLGYPSFYLAKVPKVRQRILEKVRSLHAVENYHLINIKMKMERLKQY